jgi:flagellar basal body P-ring formation protein FlgA
MLKKSYRSGEVVEANDVEMRRVARSRIRPDTITDSDDIIGKSPVRQISERRAIRRDEIAKPAVVTKNTVVEMRYEVAGMQIITKGTAVTNGAIGEMVDVRNEESKKVVRAKVIDATTVSVTPVDTSVQRVAQAEGVSYVQ